MIVVVAAVALREGRALLCRRADAGQEALKWEFPGGKVEPGEIPEMALARELREELAVDARAGRILDAVKCPGRDVLILFYECDIDGEPRLLEHSDIAWVPLEAVEARDLAAADRDFVARNRQLIAPGA